MKAYILPSIKLTLVLIVVFAIAYPLLILGVAKTAPGKGQGVTLTKNGKIVGYENVGQAFTTDKYFWSRPSAVNYNAAGAGGSNKGPGNPDYLADVQKRIDTFLAHNPAIKKADIPADMVTASGSGLDPHISVQGATVQIPRIAKVRGLSENVVRELVQKQIEKPLLSMFGTERINVLKLNLALDELK